MEYSLESSNIDSGFLLLKLKYFINIDLSQMLFKKVMLNYIHKLRANEIQEINFLNLI
jgi:hypothetical protein